MNFNAVGMTVKVREVADLMVQNGWKLVRIRAIGTLKSILRESGLHF